MTGIEVIRPAIDRPATITGAIIGSADSIAGAEVVLTPLEIGILPNKESRIRAKTASDGRFQFPDLPRGQYELSCAVFPATRTTDLLAKHTSLARLLEPLLERPTLWGREIVSVDESEVANVRIPLQAGLTVSGHVVFRGPSPPAPGALPMRAVHIATTDGRELGTFPAGRIEADGRFRLAPMPAGAYMLGLRPDAFPGWVVGSIRMAGREIGGRAFELQKDEPDVEITMLDPPTTVRGRISVLTPAPAADIIVLAFATDEALWDDFSEFGGQILRKPQPAETLDYQLPGILPGRVLRGSRDRQHPRRLASIRCFSVG